MCALILILAFLHYWIGISIDHARNVMQFFTGLALPIIYNFGPWPLFGVMLALVVLGIGSGLFYFGRLKQEY